MFAMHKSNKSNGNSSSQQLDRSFDLFLLAIFLIRTQTWHSTNVRCHVF